MHHLNRTEAPAGDRRRKALRILAIAGGICVGCKVARHVRANHETSSWLPVSSTSQWWSGVMVVLYKAFRPAAEPALVWRTTDPATTTDCATTTGSATRTDSASTTSSLGAHSQWLETFRADQTRRLKSETPSDQE